MRKYKRKSKLFLLVLLVLGISVGFALLSSTLNINGIAGIKKNTWDVHWNENSIVETEGSVEATTPAAVTDNEKKNISFDVELELPGDYYEFTADAKNYGTVDAIIDGIEIKFYDSNDEELEELPEYLKYSFTYGDGSEIQEKEQLPANSSMTYKFKIEFDSEATSLPDDPEPIKTVIDIPVGQVVPDDSSTYKITFNPNGGTVNPTTKNVTQGDAIGELPIPTKTGSQFLGWYTELVDGTKITSSTKPSGTTTYYAHWTEDYTIFDTGQNVNVAFKTLVGDTLDSTSPYNTNDTLITSIERSTTPPESGITTVNVAVEGETPIIAWYTSDVYPYYKIYWYTEADEVFLNEDASYMFNNFKGLTILDMSFNSINTTNMSYLFGGLSTNRLNLDNLDTSNTTNMTAMFASCEMLNLDVLDLSNFDTSKVTNMTAMFQGTNVTSINLSSFNTSNVTSMISMFQGCKVETLDLRNFDVSNVTNFSLFLAGTSKVKSINISGWKFNENITSLSSFFGMGLSSLASVNLKNVDASHVTNMSGMFTGATALLTINFKGFDSSSVTNMSSMFSGCSSLKTLDLSSFDVSHVTNFGGMFQGTTSLNKLNVSNWNFASVTSLASLFSWVPAETIVLENVNTSNITNMYNMFVGCSNLKELDLTDFDTSKVENMSQMFASASSLTTISVSDSFVVDQVTNSDAMFGSCNSLVGGNGTTYDSNYIDKTRAHYDYGETNPGYFNARMTDSVKVTFNANGGELSQPTRIRLERGSTIGTLREPLREGYEFLGWYTGLTDGTQIDSTYVVTNDVVIYAHWLPGDNEVYDLGELVYFDPVTTNKCDSTTFNLDNVVNGTSTCYKWRVMEIADHSGKRNIKLQMDHNLINKLAWSTTSNWPEYGPDTSLTALETATNNWVRVNPITYNYELPNITDSGHGNGYSGYGYYNLDCNNGECYTQALTVQGDPIKKVTDNLRARMITGEEVIDIINYVNPTSGSLSWAPEQGVNNHPSMGNDLLWMVENTEGPTPDIPDHATSNKYGANNWGYWTLTFSTVHSGSAWYIDYQKIFSIYPSSSDYMGIRPLINIEKNKITRD